MDKIAVLGVFGGRVPPGAEGLLANADIVAGGGIVVEAMAPPGSRQVTLGAPESLAALGKASGSVVVLASGDPGFFGIVRALGAALGSERLDVRPAPSSVAVAFARIGVPWDDAIVVSPHGGDSRAAVAAALRHPKVAVLTEPQASAADLVEALAGSGRQVTVAEALGTPAERLRSGTAESLAGQTFGGPNVVLVLDGSVMAEAAVWPPRTPERWALPDAVFEAAGAVTAVEIRALALASLGPGVGDLVWDVGCGSGSVAIECARLGAAAIGVDRDEAAVGVSMRNAAAHGVPVRIVHGEAPGALADLPDPDAVFVSGIDDGLEAVLSVVAGRARRAVVVAVSDLDRADAALGCLTGFALSATRLAVTRPGNPPADPVTVIAAVSSGA
jgi:precorrin-6Y C5,15-methyltransferase (decarboxylating)